MDLNIWQKVSIFILRISLGWLFFYAGITKILNPDWTAQGYISGAKNFQAFYEFFLSPNILPIINIINAWGLTLLGASLILGILVRISAPLGVMLMLLYYLALGFPHPNATSYIVDQHIIFIVGLFILWAFNAGRIWGFARRW